MSYPRCLRRTIIDARWLLGKVPPAEEETERALGEAHEKSINDKQNHLTASDGMAGKQ